jgi:hypothetical protein
MKRCALLCKIGIVENQGSYSYEERLAQPPMIANITPCIRSSAEPNNVNQPMNKDDPNQFHSSEVHRGEADCIHIRRR